MKLIYVPYFKRFSICEIMRSFLSFVKKRDDFRREQGKNAGVNRTS